MFAVYCVLICLYTGTLRVNITGPRGDLIDFDLLPFNTDADNNSDMFVMKFLPRCQGFDETFTSYCFYVY